MFREFRRRLIETGLTSAERSKVEHAPLQLNSAGYDEWGLDPETLKASIASLKWIYADYFRVETVGIDHIPEGRVLLVANHGGQIPIDAMLILISLALEAKPPRIGRTMFERWVPSLPFIGNFFTRCGQMLGDHRNCRELLERGECVLVFPEGVRGSGKTIFQKYQLQRFGTGFVRLALETKTPIVPVSVIGCEEAYPSLMNFKLLARLIGAPYFPVTPFFPLLGPFGILPLPSKVTIRYGKPVFFDADPDCSDAEAEAMVEQVKSAIQAEIDEGLLKRAGRIFTGSGK